MNKEYIEILRLRMEHFERRPISELDDDEIKEFMALRKEVINMVLPTIKKAWEPYSEAIEFYRERVSSNKE